jgi:crotonobetainyl-CoA:carnitine CoA-transferase CaiB-like acyl-CoA transferase
MHRLGLPPEQLRQDFPNLIVVSVSSYGQFGPDRVLGSHDLAIQGRAGILSGDDDGLGVVPTADLVAGAFAAIGALSALVARASRGGSHVDVAMLDCLVSWQAVRMAAQLMADDATGYPPSEPAHGVFRCSDGRAVTLAIAGEDRQWAALCDVLGLGDLRGLRAQARERRSGELRAAISRVLAERPSDAVIDPLEQRGVSCGRVQQVAEVLDDPQVKARKLVVDLPRGGRVVRQPLLIDGRAIATCSDAPALGEHNGRYGLQPLQPTPR